ncbi:MAG: hypothetical protein CMA27_01895 [Euryarchaeota archaeon]|nr:hypothetical protein [Euryarchaeota archaeon]|tara:strand:- start:650 stop:1354 length:705 start_codon:yes stop_codon:yes gene_type:complete
MSGKLVRVVGNSNILSDLLQDRIKDRMIHSITNNENAEITIYFIFEENLERKIIGPSIIIRPWKKDIVHYNIENCIELHLKDTLIIDSEGIWGPSDIFEWISALNSNSKIDLDKYPLRYWTPIKDIISLIETLIELPEIPTLVSDVCGRRSWFANDVFLELKMLWRRINNVKNNKIDWEDLEVKSLPITNIKINSKPPNLSKLHNLIKPINEKGWVPNTPLRICLMECLEEIIE